MQNLVGVTVLLMLMVWGSWLLRRLPALGGRRKPDPGSEAGCQPARATRPGEGGPQPELSRLEIQVGEARLQVCPQADQPQTFRLAVGCRSPDGPPPALKINGRPTGWGEEILLERFTVRVVAVDDPAGDGRP